MRDAQAFQRQLVVDRKIRAEVELQQLAVDFFELFDRQRLARFDQLRG